MPSERRHGRSEEQYMVMNTILTKSPHDLDLLMDMLMHEPDPQINNKRQRKQGTAVRHPLDLIDTNGSQSGTYQLTNTAGEDADVYGRKTSWFALRRTGSIAGSVASRKSNKSLRSTTTITSTRSTGSYVRKNSGNFDGGNKRRKSAQRKASSTSQRDQIIAEFYKELEQLEELSSSSSEDEKEVKQKDKNLERLEEETSKKRVEDYILKHSVINRADIDEDEGFDTNSETKSSNSEAKYENILNENLQKYQLYNKSSIVKKREELSRQRSAPPVKKIESTKLHLRENKYRQPTNHKPTRNFTNHADADSRKLNELLVDVNSNSVSRKHDLVQKTRAHRAQSLPVQPRNKSKTNTELIDQLYKRGHKSRERGESLQGVYDHSMSESSCSTDSAHGSTRSISTVSSISDFPKHSPVRHRASVPLNFIPGHTNAANSRPRIKSLPVSLSYVRKASFCFKGVSCRIYHNTPRTFRALAHAGCVGLVIPAPSAHKCQN